MLKPVVSTLRRIPWLEEHGADAGRCLRPSRRRSRRAARAPSLKAQLKRLAERNYVGLLRLRSSNSTPSTRPMKGHGDKRWRDLKTMGNYIEDYHIFQTTKNEPLMRAIRNGLMGAGIAVENSKGEWGPGQEEVNIRYAEALDMADQHVIMKNGIKEIAHLRTAPSPSWRNGATISPAPPRTSIPRSGTARRRSRCSPTPRTGSACRATMKSWLAGRLTLAPELTYFLAPYINSYKRQPKGFHPCSRA